MLLQPTAYHCCAALLRVRCLGFAYAVAMSDAEIAAALKPRASARDNDWPLPGNSSHSSPSAKVRVLAGAKGSAVAGGAGVERAPEVLPDSTPKRVLPAEPLPRKIVRLTRMLVTFGLVIGGFLILNCYQLAALLLLRPFSVRQYRAANSALCK